MYMRVWHTLTPGIPYTGEDEEEVRSRSSEMALRTFGLSLILLLSVCVLGAVEGGPRISNCDIVVDRDSNELRRPAFALRFCASDLGFAGGGIMMGSSMFFSPLITADSSGEGLVGGGGASSCGGGRRIRMSPSRLGIHPSGGTSTLG